MSKLNDKIICLVGKSGSGKSYIAKHLSEKYGYKILLSYTTREKRGDNDNDHIFITENEYYALPQKVATTFFDRHHYCATRNQIDENDIYIIDIEGLKQLKRLYSEFGGTKKIVSIYVDVPMEWCLKRMRHRGDSEDKCWERLRHDDTAFSGAFSECDYSINGIPNTAWIEVEKLIKLS